MANTEELTLRITDLLTDLRERPDIELKSWLNITDDKLHKATLAKAIIAQANHGGGFVVIGIREENNESIEAPDRPSNLNEYTVDNVNAVVQRYIEPAFHCDVQHVRRPGTDLHYPVVIVPGGHRFPIRSKVGVPNGEELTHNAYYIRRAGPRSEPPQTAQEWDDLIRRCIQNNRDDLLTQFRRIMDGGITGQEPQPTELEQVDAWVDVSTQRWQTLADTLPAGTTCKLEHGHYSIAYQFFANGLEPLRGNNLLDALRVRPRVTTGWPPFVVFHRDGITPYVFEDNIESWLGQEPDERATRHSDFWQASPSGQFFLLRGYQEDDQEISDYQPGEAFDLTLPTWRVAEVLYHAMAMAEQFGGEGGRLTIVVEWTGLAGRWLRAWANSNRTISDRYQARQDVYRSHVSLGLDALEDSMPEVVDHLIRGLYELFDFFPLPPTLVAEEIDRLRRGVM